VHEHEARQPGGATTPGVRKSFFVFKSQVGGFDGVDFHSITMKTE
jgi:hypothetical protein